MRVVSLVPSLTEAVAATVPEMLVGATDYCTHPAGLDVARVGGSKYPDLDRVRALRPDLVLVNMEENRAEDAEALRAAGIGVHVTFPRTVDEALTELSAMLTVLGATGEPGWLTEARRAWAAMTPDPPGQAAATSHPPREAGTAPGPARRAVVPVWRKPWVVVGGGTFATDVLRRLGVTNLYADHPDRYPRPALDEIHGRRPDLVVLPDEPYLFTADDGPEAFPGTPYALVSGRHLTWYGPSLAEAPALLGAQLDVAQRSPSEARGEQSR